MRSLDDTIAAIATPPGEGGISIVRISGPRASTAARGLLRLGSGEPPELPPREAVFCRAVRPGTPEVIDEVLAIFMAGPASYTREDVVEIQCHGGRAAAGAILDLLLSSGARLADPGEFTLRAYLRGRIDLVQAEAVADVIHAETADSLKVHETLLEGALSREVAGWQEGLGTVLVHLESFLDFPEEELDLKGGGELVAALDEIASSMAGKLETFAWGRTAREGFRVAILGLPNVGKSSLLNRLAEEERAIVSPIAGTTRDTIEVRVNALGAPVHVIDTAGLRSPADTVEEEGVLRARRAAEAAGLVLMVYDGYRLLEEEERKEALALIPGGKVLAVVNKADLGRVPAPELSALFGEDPLFVSARTGEGVEELLRRIRDRAWSGRVPTGGGALTRLRHRESVKDALDSVEKARGILAGGGYPDAAANELQRARRFLAELLGWGTPEEVVDRIFSEFCIGK